MTSAAEAEAWDRRAGFASWLPLLGAALAGALAAALATGAPLLDAVRAAVEVASAAVGRAGAR